jgi:hypothetical protein
LPSASAAGRCAFFSLMIPTSSLQARQGNRQEAGSRQWPVHSRVAVKLEAGSWIVVAWLVRTLRTMTHCRYCGWQQRSPSVTPLEAQVSRVDRAAKEEEHHGCKDRSSREASSSERGMAAARVGR